MELHNKLLNSKIAKRLLFWYIIAVTTPFTLYYMVSATTLITPDINSIWQFLLVVPLSLCIVLMVAFRQIRRFVIPIYQLRDATRNIAERKFDTQLEIHSNDEFEELATTLNQMSLRLGKQFNTLETMAHIDRLILSTLKIENIVEIILSRMVNVVPCDSVSVLITKPNKEQSAFLYYREQYLSAEINCESVLLSDDDLHLIQNNPVSLLVENNGYSPGFLVPLRQQFMNFLLLPIFLENKLSAVLILAFKNDVTFNSEDVNQARDLAHRVAVALSNSAWEDKLYHRAHYDMLTELPNRLLFQDRLQHAIERAKRDKTVVALMFIDLNRFKFVNDSLGHVAGDQYLHEIAKRLRGCTRSIDTVARLGGDEFTIIFPDLQDGEDTLTDISQMANKVLRLAGEPVIIDDQEIMPSFSIGISLYPRDTHELSDLLRHADSAMYYAKSKVKSNYQFYSQELNIEAKTLLQLETQLRHALENDEFKIYYQPRVNVKTQQIVSVEALLRWDNPENGIQLPIEFIPIIEETGLIHDVGEWILETACNDIQSLQKTGHPELAVSVNISAHQFSSDNLINTINEALYNSGLDPKYLELEITESILMKDTELAMKLLQELHNMNISFAVDDFGTGYSSLSYLKKFPISTLKIDQSFISQIDSDHENACIVNAIIGLAHNLNLSVVAEGVETEAELEHLADTSCDEIQGFLYAKPMPIDQLLQFLQSYQSVQPYISRIDKVG